jgi:hypothetical protein
MQRITISHSLEVFSPDFLRDNVGSAIPFKVPGFRPVEATLVAVGIAGDGRTALLTLDVPDLVPITEEQAEVESVLRAESTDREPWPGEQS